MQRHACAIVCVLVAACAASAVALDVPPTAVAQAAAWEADPAVVASRRAAHAEALVGATPASYDLDLALRLMHMCAAAYCPTGIQTWTCNACTSPGFNVSAVVTEKTWGLLAFVGYDPVNNTVVVSFRGSDNWENWVLDLWAVRVAGQPAVGCSAFSRRAAGAASCNTAVLAVLTNTALRTDSNAHQVPSLRL